jgi:amino acid adenylation domain-containing protein
MPELAQCYAAFSTGHCPALAPPLLQYADYAAWRQRAASSEDVSKQISYWRRILIEEGAPTALKLPCDHVRTGPPSYRGGMETFRLSHALCRALKRLSRDSGVTLYVTLLAAFKALLHRYADEEDIVIGIVVDMRRRSELERLIGYFLNTIALRSRPSRVLPFRQYLTQVRDAVLEALCAAEVPFDRVAQEVLPKGERDRRPLFSVLFSMEPPAEPFAEGWDLTQMDVTVGVTKYDLYLELDERLDRVIGRIFFSSDLFEAATIQRMIGHWISILEAVSTDASRRLADLPLLTAQERHQMSVAWNDTRRDWPFMTLLEAFDARLQHAPEAVAVVDEGVAWSYRALDKRADRIAAGLTKEHLGRGAVIAICMERSLDLIASLLAIMKTGAAYLPLDPAEPQVRRSLILENAAPALLLTDRVTMPVMADAPIRVVCCEDLCVEGGSAFQGNRAAVQPDDLAYIIYTSGSTGGPKGVEISHRALINLLLSMQREPGFGADDILLAVTTISFDIAALELFLPLVSGGRVVLAGSDVVSDLPRLMEAIDDSGCTFMQATPALWRSLVEAGWSGSDHLTILCGGDVLTRDLADRLAERGASLWNMYGPTETTIWSAIHKVQRGDGRVPIGRPIANTRVYILDTQGQLVPVGVPGELHIGGAGLARGYRQRAQLTAERFLAVNVAGERLYRTGDIVSYRPDGFIDYHGRVDNQVKIRGRRIELEEIEAALVSHPKIAAAAVKAWTGPSDERYLVAYWVCRDDEGPEPAQLRRFLLERLPDYMAPVRFERLSSLPMTPSGKVARKALAEPSPLPMPGRAVAPRNDRERKLAAIWCQVLGIATVGVHDDFFDLGGHSLLVAKLLHRIEVDFARRLSAGAVFHASTVAAMAELLAEDRPRRAPFPGSRPQADTGPVPLLWIRPEPSFRRLAQSIAASQPFLSLDLDPQEHRDLNEDATLSELAARLIHTIRRVQARGPYFIGGWCSAGILAFEVASQLIEAGDRVDLLVLIHASNPARFREIGALELELSKLKHHAVQVFLRGKAAESVGYAVERARRAFHRLAQRGRPWSMSRRRLDIGEIIERAALAYQPRPYAGDVVLLQPLERPDVLDYRPGWEELVTGNFVAYDVPGDHHTMFGPPHIDHLNAVMRTSLARARGENLAIPQSSLSRGLGRSGVGLKAHESTQ